MDGIALTGAPLSPVITQLRFAHALHASLVSTPGAQAAQEAIEKLTALELIACLVGGCKLFLFYKNSGDPV
jgi:hypothetical protein